MSEPLAASATSTSQSSAHPFAGTRAAGAPRVQWSLAIAGRLVVGALVLALLLVGVGLLLTHVWDTWTHTDGFLDRWFLSHRVVTWNRVTFVGSSLAQTTSAGAVALVAFFALRVWLRRWYESFVLVVALGGEVLIFLTVTAIVHRPRPSVPRLDPAPPTSSFPSGHTAAAVTVFGFLAFILWRYMANRWLANVVCLILIAIPVGVGISRVYRGAHYPSDVIGGAVLGVVWLSFVIRTLMPAHPVSKTASRVS